MQRVKTKLFVLGTGVVVVVGLLGAVLARCLKVYDAVMFAQTNNRALQDVLARRPRLLRLPATSHPK